MEKWREICAAQAARLELAQNLCRHALNLCAHERVKSWVKAADIEKLRNTEKNIKQKLARLQKSEFHIAVVGLEKAGKSSFINAWLESDLLPNKSDRCTFTTTRLHSAQEHEQRLEVFPKTQEEMCELERMLGEEANGADKHAAEQAKEDLELIRDHRTELDEIIRDGHKVFPFNDLDEISDNLNKYAADPHYAHAVRQVELYTSRLARMDNILFYDVPGLDSGLSKHIKETREMLADSDAVIIVKKFEDPSFKGSEKEILRYVEEGDDSVPVNEKVFLFISKIDKEATRSGFESNKEKILQECRQFNLAEDKVVFGAAAAVLHLKDRLKDTQHIIEKTALKKHLCTILDLPDDNTETVIKAAGIEEIRKCIENYLENDRIVILKRSCDRLIKTVEDCAYNFRTVVAAHVPEDPEKQKRKHEQDISVRLQSWITEKWREILASISDRDRESENINKSIVEIESGYKENVQKTFENLQCFLPEKRDRTLQSIQSTKGNDIPTLNTTWRREHLYGEILQSVEELSLQLSSRLYVELDKYMDTLSQKFNDCIDVKNRLLTELKHNDVREYSASLDNAIRALFLRYARPLVIGLIKNRHGSDDRKKQYKELAKDFVTLSNAYPEEGNPDFQDLRKYVQNGPAGDNIKKSVENAVVNGIGRKVGKGLGSVMGGAIGGPLGSAVGGTIAEAAGSALTKMAHTATSTVTGTANDETPAETAKDPLEAVIAEVQQDCTVLQAYLEDAVFECSGIADFADQEFERVYTKFKDCKDAFSGELRTAFDYQDPKLLEILPEDLRHQECDTRISDLLSELVKALQNRR